MIDKIKQLLSGSVESAGAEGDDGDDARAAVAALLVEAGRMDQNFSDEERGVVTSLLTARFELSEADANDLIDDAEKRASASAQYFPFTHRINQSMSDEEKSEVIEMLWSVAYADGTLDPYEDQLIRQIAGLIHVTDRERMLARKRALAKDEQS